MAVLQILLCVIVQYACGSAQNVDKNLLVRQDAAADSELNDFASSTIPDAVRAAASLRQSVQMPVRDDPFNNGTSIDGHALPEWFSVAFNGILLGLGLLEVIAGYRLFRYTMMLLSALAAGLPVFLLTWDNLQGPNAFWVGVGMGSMAAILGAIASYFLWKVGVFLIGGALGVTLALILNVTVLSKLSPGNPNLPLEVAGVLLGLVFGVLALRFMRVSVIISTSVVGAFAFIRSVGHFAGGYPASELDLEAELENGQTNLPWTVYVYFASICILAIAGVAIQLLVTARKAKGSGKDDNEVAFDNAANPLDLVLGKKRKQKGKGKGKKKSKRKGGSSIQAGTAVRSTKVDALLRDYEAGGEFYEGAEAAYEEGEEYTEEGAGVVEDGYGYAGDGMDTSYEVGGGPAPSPARSGGMFSAFTGRGKTGASSGKKVPAAVDW